MKKEMEKGSDNSNTTKNYKYADQERYVNPSYAKSNNRWYVSDRVSGKACTLAKAVICTKYPSMDLTGLHIHHVDGDSTNDRPSNLIVLTPSEHRMIHSERTSNEAQNAYNRMYRRTHNQASKAWQKAYRVKMAGLRWATEAIRWIDADHLVYWLEEWCDKGGLQRTHVLTDSDTAEIFAYRQEMYICANGKRIMRVDPQTLIDCNRGKIDLAKDYKSIKQI